MASLQREIKTLHALADDLLATVLSMGHLEMKFQRLVVETAMLRLHYGLEEAVANVGHKLLMNTSYCDARATTPTLLRPAFRSVAASEAGVIAVRGKSVRYVKWTTLADVKSNLSAFLPATEHFLVERGVLDPVFEDMRHVRNHIAHGTKGTRAKFGTVVLRVYPADPRGISPGKFLLSKRVAFTGASGHGRQTIIEQYLRWTKVAIKSLAKA